MVQDVQNDETVIYFFTKNVWFIVFCKRVLNFMMQKEKKNLKGEGERSILTVSVTTALTLKRF